MTLKEKIDFDFKNSLKKKDTLKVSVLRLIKSAVKNAEIEKRKEYNDEEILSVIEKQAKQRKDSIALYKKAGRDDLKEQEEAELSIIEQYLPEKMSEAEVKETIEKIFETISEEERTNFGRVMGRVMQELKGKADPGVINKIVKEKTG